VVRDNGLMFRTFALAMLVACDDGGDASKLVGTWTGTAAGYAVTADVQAEYPNAGTFSLQGVMSTDRPACFTNAMLAGTLAATSVDLLASGNGTASGTTIVRIRGELAGDTITAQLDVTTALAECSVTAAPVVLMR
jgi:hypothetical protein